MTLPELATERLWLRPLAIGDAGDLHAVFGDPVCMRFWHRPIATTPDDSRRYVQDMLDHDAGNWAIGCHGSAAVKGFVGFVNGLEPGGHAGFGYAIRRDEWGRGLVVEAARAALDHGFGAIGIARTELWIQRENGQSIRVAEKLGCTRRSIAALDYERGPVLSAVHGITAEVWGGQPEVAPLHLSVEPILAVSDVGRALAWWRDVLGFRVDFAVGEPPTHARLLADPGWTAGPGVQLTLADPAGGGRVFITVGRELDELAARAAGQVVTPLGVRPWGMREVELADDDGNRIRLVAPAGQIG